MQTCSNLNAILTELESMAAELGYKVEWQCSGIGFCHYLTKTIKIDNSLSLSEKAIFLAHELGHAQDHSDNHPGIEELVLMLKFFENYKLGESYFQREKRAWDKARASLEFLGAWSRLGAEFEKLRSRSLENYLAIHLAAKHNGSDRPDNEELSSALALVSQHE